MLLENPVHAASEQCRYNNLALIYIHPVQIFEDSYYVIPYT